MSVHATFPLPWEQVLWSSSPAFPLSLARPGTRYALTDFRLVVNRTHRTIDELALHDIARVRLTQAWWQRATGTSTVRVYSTRSRSPLELANIRHGPQLALVLQLRATELFGDEAKALDAEFFRHALGPGAGSILLPPKAGIDRLGRSRPSWNATSCPSRGARSAPSSAVRTT